DHADDAAARKARADAIRRARDLRNAGLAPAADDLPASDAAESAEEPNYVDLIDRKMKEMEEEG
ncbi:MAG TPA: hypothetical protein VF771_03965, partial [Longimicrobiaceae bacterium]